MILTHTLREASIHFIFRLNAGFNAGNRTFRQS